jgi:hypothetical protein
VTVARESTESQRELIAYAVSVGAGRPFRQGTNPDLCWDFTSADRLERAQLFAANA